MHIVLFVKRSSNIGILSAMGKLASAGFLALGVCSFREPWAHIDVGAYTQRQCISFIRNDKMDDNNINLLKSVLSHYEIEIFSTENHQIATACLRVLDSNFCLTRTNNGRHYFIKHSLHRDQLSMLYTDMGSKLWINYIYDLGDALHKKSIEARIKCEAIFSYFSSLEQEEEKRVQNKIELEDRFRR
jgi:hypothetical protein